MNVKREERGRSTPSHGSAPRPRTQAERSEATRAALLRAARELFAERGYAGVGTEEIVRRSGVTRGALYHHFRGKADLFRAVFERLEQELAERFAGEALARPDPWEALGAGAELFLDVCLEPEVQRIALLDAPSVLGWEEWREIEARYSLGLIRAGLEAAMEAGAIERRPLDALAHVILGAMMETGLFVARAADVPAARAEGGEVLRTLLESLRPQPPPGRPRGGRR
jgi:AcrR family transcriptional regulator